MIKSYHRALNSGIAWIQEAATREADGRGWDLEAVERVMQEAGSTGGLLQDEEQVLQELREEARASWEE
jgi:hypothetical protein